MPAQKPSIVLVAGAWHQASTWSQVTSILESEGYNCIPIGLPSASSDGTKVFLDDLLAVRTAIEHETTQEKRDVVVVVHSYGGLVGESAIKGLTGKSKSSPDENGHVVGLVVIASGFAPMGKSFMELTGGVPPPFWTPNWDTGMAILVADTRDLFYHDLPEEEGNLWVSRLTGQSLKALYEGGEHVYTGWLDVPNFYCATTQDHALPIEMQRMGVDLAKAAGAKVEVREIESSHSPMLSRPEETAAVVIEAAETFSKSV
jgi:pimeloyl-ACP methyl ester carboxylesterase